MGIYNATSALLNQLPNGQQPTAQHQLQQQGKQQNGDFDNFPTREDYRNGFILVIRYDSYPVKTGAGSVITGLNRSSTGSNRYFLVFSLTFLG